MFPSVGRRVGGKPKAVFLDKLKPFFPEALTSAGYPVEIPRFQAYTKA